LFAHALHLLLVGLLELPRQRGTFSFVPHLSMLDVAVNACESKSLR